MSDDRPVTRPSRGGLTRRQLGLIVTGGALAACTSQRPARQLAGRPPTRVIALPGPDTVGGPPLSGALARRHSVRRFAGTPVGTKAIGQLLWAAQGVTRSWGGRTAPSAGALYPLDIYAVTANRLWHYLPDGHRAEQWDVAADLAAELRQAAMGQSAVDGSPLLFVVCGTIWRTRGKYGDRATRYVALEAGHCAENVLLQATALGLAAVPIGAFSDESVRRSLGLSSALTPYYLIPVGVERT